MNKTNEKDDTEIEGPNIIKGIKDKIFVKEKKYQKP
jgi:hypothetical protein